MIGSNSIAFTTTTTITTANSSSNNKLEEKFYKQQSTEQFWNQKQQTDSDNSFLNFGFLYNANQHL